MNLLGRPAAVFVTWALAVRAQVGTGQGQVPHTPYSHESGGDMRSGGRGGGV
jgi:hypothetical protein